MQFNSFNVLWCVEKPWKMSCIVADNSLGIWGSAVEEVNISMLVTILEIEHMDIPTRRIVYHQIMDCSADFMAEGLLGL
jgi:hypothetical protein